MMVIDFLVVLSFFMQCCFFYMLLQSLDTMGQDCFLAYKKKKKTIVQIIEVKELKHKLKIESEYIKNWEFSFSNIKHENESKEK